MSEATAVTLFKTSLYPAFLFYSNLEINNDSSAGQSILTFPIKHRHEPINNNAHYDPVSGYACLGMIGESSAWRRVKKITVS